jgi:hypothetical protein
VAHLATILGIDWPSLKVGNQFQSWVVDDVGLGHGLEPSLAWHDRHLELSAKVLYECPPSDWVWMDKVNCVGRFVGDRKVVNGLSANVRGQPSDILP